MPTALKYNTIGISKNTLVFVFDCAEDFKKVLSRICVIII